MVNCLPATQKTRVQSLGREDPLEKDMVTHSISSPGESHGQRSLVVQGVAKSQTRLSNFTSAHNLARDKGQMAVFVDVTTDLRVKNTHTHTRKAM